MADTDEKTISVVENPVPAANTVVDGGTKKEVEEGRSAAEEAAADLTRQLDALKATAARDKSAREEAERRARAAEARAVQTEGEAKSSTLTAITNAIEARTSVLATLQTQLASQWQDGNFDEAAKSQVKISSLTADLQRLGEAKDFAENQAKSPRQEQPAPSGPITDVDEFLRVTRLPPKSSAWLKDHPDALQRQKKLARAHDEALEEAGFETPEYFSIIEKIMGYEKKSAPSIDEGANEPPPTAAPQTRRAPAAPPSTSSATTSRGRVEVRMTPEMRRAAEIAGISEEEYAKNYLLAKKQGLIN